MYLQVTATFAQWADSHEITGAFPLNSITIGKGRRRSEVTMQQACDGTNNRWDTVKTRYEARVTNQTWCAPAADMCVSPPSINDQFAFINIPIFNFDSTADYDGQGGLSVFAETVISLVDRQNKISKTKISVRVPIVRAGTNLWCKPVEAQTDLGEVLNVDLWVGTAESDSELTRLRLFEDIASRVGSPQVPPPAARACDRN
eukprot:2673245-Rhodomonas_salina.1